MAECKIVPDDGDLEPQMDVTMEADFTVGFGTIREARWLDGKPVIPTFVNVIGG
jgi:hypothetical protein